MSTPDPVSTVTNAVTGMGGDLLTIGGTAIGIGAGVFILRKGWKVLRSLVG